MQIWDVTKGKVVHQIKKAAPKVRAPSSLRTLRKPLWSCLGLRNAAEWICAN